jgi:hypothetical protein
VEPQDADGEVWYVKEKDKERFLTARRGDNLLVSFQCDLCVFRTVTGRKTPTDSAKDKLLLACIRRCILDSFWAREPGTATSTLNGINNIIRDSLELGIKPPCPARYPLPREDIYGYGVALLMVFDSLKSGNYSKKYKQFESIRKIRTHCSNLWDAMAHESVGRPTLCLLTADKSRMSETTTSPTQSRWFRRFVRGC